MKAQGSLRRPPALIEAHSAYLKGTVSAHALKALEDKAIDDAASERAPVSPEPPLSGAPRRADAGSDDRGVNFTARAPRETWR